MYPNQPQQQQQPYPTQPPSGFTSRGPSPPPLVHPVPVPASRTAVTAAAAAGGPVQSHHTGYAPAATPGYTPSPSFSPMPQAPTPQYHAAAHQNQYTAPYRAPSGPPSLQGYAPVQPPANPFFGGAQYAPVQPGTRPGSGQSTPGAAYGSAASLGGGGYQPSPFNPTTNAAGVPTYQPVSTPAPPASSQYGGASTAAYPPASQSQYNQGGYGSSPALFTQPQQQMQQVPFPQTSPFQQPQQQQSYQQQPQQQSPYQQPYQPQQQQQQQFQQQQSQQQQSQQPQPQVGQAFAQAFAPYVNDPAAQIGLQLGSKAMDAGQAYVNQNLGRFVNVPHLKFYFNVSNSYVLNKLRLVMFPFRQGHWHRMVRRPDGMDPNVQYQQQQMMMQQLQQQGQGVGVVPQITEFRPPREDLMSPDLYIPVMAFVTYVLLIGVEMGTRNKFHPSELGMTSSTAFFLVLAEVLLVKLGCYLFSVQTQAPMLDLLSYAGYKFVGIILTTLAALVLPAWGFWAALVYTSLATGFFSMRSMKYIVIPEAAVTTTTTHIPQRRRRLNFLLAVVGLQIFAAWLLVPWARAPDATIPAGEGLRR
ncbi:Protein transport protein yif1 [Blastocladiella emersonii ATCC 22665]|nr:Protein transport protein yif1 [Blastocladiella emersonii ATCC 22665]